MAAEVIPDSAEPDPGRVFTLEDFGRELTLARDQAGLTVRQAAREAGIPVSTAGDYFAGRHLPSASQAGTLRKILNACGVSGTEHVDAWVLAAGRVRQLMGGRPARGVLPYRGLAAFEAGDAGWFFGREGLIRLLTRVVADGGLGIPVTVTGPSGAGKSSLLRAGLIPWLESGADRESVAPAWQVVVFTPDASPLTRLIGQVSDVMGVDPGEARAWLRAVARDPGGPRTGAADGLGGYPRSPGHMANGLAGEPAQEGPRRLALVVDQFEEVFTACQDEGERQEFIATLAALAGVALVVLGLRADFYGHALRYPELAASLQHRQVVVGPMTRDQLRQAIVEPARKAALALDPALPELLLNDLAPLTGQGQAAPYGHEAGSLPLLSHALLATWERGRRNRLTVADYLAAGGIRDAVAHTAEAAYAALSDEEKEGARRLFLRLVRVADDSPLTRTTVPLTDLQDPGTPDGVLARFVKDRLVTLDENAAWITHEALLSAWPRLRGWISADQEDLKIRDRIVSAARGWQESGRDDAALLRGGPLAVAADWAAKPANRDSLSLLARSFMDSALAHEQARVASERRRVGRLRRLVTALTVLVLLAGGLAGYAFQQRRAAIVAKNHADSRELAVEAEQIRGEDPSLAAQLSVAAFKISPTRGALASLLESAAYPAAARFRDSGSVVQALALAAGHRVLAVAGADGTLRLWDVARPGHPVPFGAPLTRSHGSSLYAVAFSPDGRVLAAAGAGRTIQLWDVASPQHPVRLGPPLTGPRNTVYSLTFSPDGRVLAAGGADGTIRLWNVLDPRHPIAIGAPLTGPTGYVEAIAISPDGALLAAASADKTVRLWNISNPRHPLPLGHPLTGPAVIVDTVAFSPDGHTLAAGSRDNSVWLWNITDPAHPVRARPPLTDATDWVNAVAFSPDGHVLAAASSDDQVLLWNAATGALLATLPSPQPVTSLSWDGNHTLIAGGADGFVRLWTVPPPILLDGGPVNQVSFSPDGKLLAIAGPSLQLWDTATRTQVANATAGGAFANSVAWAPGGTVLATGYSDGTVRLWQWAHGRLTSLGAPLRATSLGIVEYVTFRRGGQVLASTGDDGTVRLWNVADPSHPAPLAVIHDSATYVFSAAFSPDGKVLAAASADNRVRLWDVSDPARPRALGTPLTGPASYAISVAFSPNGNILAVGSADHTVRLWNVTVPSRPHPIGAPLTGPGGYVYSVTFSPHGTTLAAGVTDGTIWLWNVGNPASPALITHLQDALHATGHVYTVAYSPGGATLAAGSSGGEVRLWDTRSATAAAALCAAAGQPLTRAEWNSYLPGRPYQPPCAG